MTSGVYSLTFPNGTVYIGSTVDLDDRVWRHRNSLVRGVHENPQAQHTWNKYGSFEFSVLEECSKELLRDREQVWIDQEDKKLLLNVMPARQSDHFKPPITKEARAKISMALKGRVFTPEHRAKLSAAKKGKPPHTWTEESRQKLSQAKMGNPSRTGMRRK